MTIKEYFDSQKWIFARTYAAFAPHEYIVRSKVDDKNLFDMAFNYIEENGIRMFYYKTEKTYLFVGGWFYWGGRDSVDDPTAIINRCKASDYDIVFVRKNTWLTSKKAQEENVQLELDLTKMMESE